MSLLFNEIYIHTHTGCSKNSRPHADFRFVVHLSLLYGSHTQKSREKSELVFLVL